MKISLLWIISSLVLISSCNPSARYRANNLADEPYVSQESSANLDYYIREWLNSPYKYGGMSKEGVDCSGFTKQVMINVFQIELPRTSEEQYHTGNKISDSRRRPGDLVFVVKDDFYI